MPKEMLINVSAGEECRIALVEDGQLEEIYLERSSAASHVGSVYKGRVMNVEASIQAAFIDFGSGRNGFLHISDLMPTYFGKRGEKVVETVGRKMARRDRPPIQQCLRRGDEIVVQIIKEGIGTKGPTLSSYVSIPGRILVMMPGVAKTGVSRKIEDEEERRRLRKILDELKPPKDVGFIIRTAGVGKSKAEIERDFKYLSRLWEQIQKKLDESDKPCELYAEGDLVTRSVRDVFTSDVEKIVVDDKDTAKRIKDFFKLLMPRTKNKVEVYDDPVPLFHKYKIEQDIEQMHSRTVPLKNGGYLIIDSTEAVVAIDVNSGKFRDHSDAETTAFKTDMEAADEIARQLRLRDLGGVVICDFIDLRYERHRRELEQRLAENLKRDRAKTRFLRMSEFGIIEMTRQRMRPSLKRAVFHECPSCKGHGLVKTQESMALDVMRKIAIAANDLKVKRVELSLAPEVGYHILNKKRAELAELEEETGKKVLIKVDPKLSLDDCRFELFDDREGVVWLEVLGMDPPTGHGHGSSQGRDRGGRDRGRDRGGRDRGGRDQGRHGGGRNADVERDDDDREAPSGELEDEIADEGEGTPGGGKRPEREPDKLDDDQRRRAGERVADGNVEIGSAPTASDFNADDRNRRGGSGGGRDRGRNGRGRDRGRGGPGGGRDDRGPRQGGGDRGRSTSYTNDPGIEEFDDGPAEEAEDDLAVTGEGVGSDVEGVRHDRGGHDRPHDRGDDRRPRDERGGQHHRNDRNDRGRNDRGGHRDDRGGHRDGRDGHRDDRLAQRGDQQRGDPRAGAPFSAGHPAQQGDGGHGPQGGEFGPDGQGRRRRRRRRGRRGRGGQGDFQHDGPGGPQQGGGPRDDRGDRNDRNDRPRREAYEAPEGTKPGPFPPEDEFADLGPGPAELKRQPTLAEIARQALAAEGAAVPEYEDEDDDIGNRADLPDPNVVREEEKKKLLKRGRRTRGGAKPTRGGGGQRGGQGGGNRSGGGNPQLRAGSGQGGNAAKPQRTPPQSRGPAPSGNARPPLTSGTLPPVVKTGSSDRHQLGDDDADDAPRSGPAAPDISSFLAKPSVPSDLDVINDDDYDDDR